MHKIVRSAAMRAVQVQKFGGSEVLQVALDVAKPTVGNSQVLVKLEYSGVNPVDTYIRNGAYGVLPDLPYIPGKDGSGVVEQVGKDVKDFKIGDPVFLTQNGQHGTLAEYVAVDQCNTFPLDKKLSFAQGAGIVVPYFTAHRALYVKGRGVAGCRVLVHGGSGAVGQAVIQLASADGMTVVATAGTAEGQQVTEACGATAVYNHREADYLSKLTKECGKFDVIVEMLSNVNLNHDLTLLNPRGTVVVVGCRGDVSINPRLLMGPELSIVGCANFAATPEEWCGTASAVLTAIAAGHVRPRVAKTYALHEAPSAHDYMVGEKSSLGKIVVKCNVISPDILTVVTDVKQK